MVNSKLITYFNDERVGVLSLIGDQLAFEYDSQWIQNRFPISPWIPFDEDISSDAIKRFLENLFPEGSALDELKEYFKVGISNTFAITQIIGRDTTGALRFLVDGISLDEESSFRELSEEELAERLDQRATKGLAIWDGKIRLSVAGVQDKLPITILSDGRMGFGEGQIASTHILKFQKREGKVSNLVLNEYFCMKLAALVGIDVPEVDLKFFGDHPALLVKRFDRKIESDDEILRYHIIDGCQALNVLSSYRYERNFGSGRDVAGIREGVSLKKLFDFSMRCEVPAMVQFKMLEWILFNLIIGNSDAHGKNISYFVDRGKLKLAPFYDLVNVTIYPDLDHELAMSVGDEFDPKEIFAFQLAEFCDEVGIKKMLLAKQLTLLCKKVEKAIGQLQIPREFEGKEAFWESLMNSVNERVEHYSKLSSEVVKF